MDFNTVKFCNICENQFNIVQKNKNIVYHCDNCNNENAITDNIKLYQFNLNTKYDFVTDTRNRYLANNPIFNHVHNLICKNNNCPSHQTNKYDIVWYKKHNNYKAYYICRVCFHEFTIDNNQ